MKRHSVQLEADMEYLHLASDRLPENSQTGRVHNRSMYNSTDRHLMPNEANLARLRTYIA